MCGIVNDAFNFVKDSVGEVFSHPGEAAGALFGIPGYDPAIGGMFNSDHALINPTGDFTSSAWNDMAQAHPEDSGVLGTMQGVNAVADKVAPAIAGYYAGGATAFGGMGDSGSAAGIGADTFSTGLGDAGASSLGGLESGMGGAGLFGAGAGTGTAIGSGVAQGLGAGGLGMADASALGGLASSGGTYAGALGGGTQGTGLGSMTSGGANLTGAGGTPSPVDLGGSSGTSMEGGQAAAMPGGNGAAASGAMGNPGDASGAYAPSGGGTSGTNLSTMFGPDSTGAGSPMGTSIGQSTSGVGAGPSGGSFDAVTSGANGVGATDIPGQSIGSNYGTAANSADQGGDFLSNLFRSFTGGAQAGSGGIGGTGIQGNDIMNLMKIGQSAWQQHQASQKANAYAGSIANMFSPNSAYAQQMQQTLARQDAAAGRNSQYGTRATQLAAALTQAQAQAMGNNNYAQASQNTAGTNVLNGIFNAFGNPAGMQSAGRLGTAAFNGLSSLFG